MGDTVKVRVIGKGKRMRKEISVEEKECASC